jgi:hypothetical protein
MAACKCVLGRTGSRDVLLLREPLEGVEHALARLPRRGQEPQTCLVRRGFLGAPVSQKRAHQQLVAADHDPGAGSGRALSAAGAAGNHHADAQELDEQALGLVAGDALAQLGQMPASDVAGLVRDDADHLIGRFRLLQRAGVNEHVAAVEHECVERLVPHDAHLDPARSKSGRPEYRPRIILEQVFDFRIAHQTEGLGRGGPCRRHRKARKADGAGHQ